MNFKQGEKVIRFGHRGTITEHTITKISARQIKIDNDERFTLDGYLIGGTQIYRIYIKPATTQLRQEIAAEQQRQETADLNARKKAAVLAFVEDMAADEIDNLYQLLRNKGMGDIS